MIAKLSGVTFVSPTVCNASEEPEKTADAKEILAVHLPTKIQLMVYGTGSETPHGEAPTAKLACQLSGPNVIVYDWIKTTAGL